MIDIDINSCLPHRHGTHSEFVSAEKQCRHVGKNPDKDDIRQYKIDGEVILSNSPLIRCDFLLLNDTWSRAYYIELKGSDISKATKQIDSTIKLISPSIPTYKTMPRIVCRTATHTIKNADVIKWRHQYGSRAVIQERKLVEIISGKSE